MLLIERNISSYVIIVCDTIILFSGSRAIHIILM